MAAHDQAAIFLAVLGLFPYVMNWAIVIHNKRGKKWSSPVPPLGGLLIFIGGLISSIKPLALIGLTDPAMLMILSLLVSLLLPKSKNDK